MVFGFNKFKEKAKKALRIKDEPRQDIMRENIEIDEPKNRGFQVDSIIGHIRKNWVDGRH
jgi:hypothetical protein